MKILPLERETFAPPPKQTHTHTPQSTAIHARQMKRRMVLFIFSFVGGDEEDYKGRWTV